MFDIFASIINNVVTIKSFVICIAVSLALGAVIAFVVTRTERYTKSFVWSVILIPAVVQTVIMIVNGNLGAGVAIAGAFTLVRFRYVPAAAKDITIIFISMAAGLACGMGYIGVAVIFTVILCTVIFILSITKTGVIKKSEKELKITIPESLDYSNVFDDIFREYTESYELTNVKTTNMGSLYKLSYIIVMSAPDKEKEFIDKLRCRNGNLEISCGRPLQNDMI